MIAALPILLLGVALHERPVVSVETASMETAAARGEADLRRLRGALLVRLLEEGYPIAPRAEKAQVRLLIRSSQSGWTLEVLGADERGSSDSDGDIDNDTKAGRGKGSSDSDIDNDAKVGRGKGMSASTQRVEPGPLGVVSLELLQRAILALEEVKVSRVGLGEADARVAIVLSETTSDDFGSRLREAIALELSESGLSLVPRPLPHDELVCLSVDSHAVTIAKGTQAGSCAAPSVQLSRQTLSDEEVLLAVPSRVSTLMPATPRPNSNSSSNSNTTPNTTPNTMTDPGRASTQGEAWHFGLSAGAGFSVRSGGTDPVVYVATDAMAHSGFGLRLDGRFSWSRGLGPLSITESSAQIGPAWRTDLGRSTTFDLALLGGFVFHRFYFSESDQGSRVNGACSLAGQFTYSIGLVRLGLLLAPGIATPPRDHQMLGEMAWRRGIFSVHLLSLAGVSL